MITLKDIQAGISKVLKDNGFSVTAYEVKEGFSKPTTFIDVMPVSVTLQNKFTELVNVSAEILYFPSTETKEEIIKVSEKLKKMFLYSPITVGDRFLSTDEIVFDYDKSVLIAGFDIEFLQETVDFEEELPKMETFTERTVTKGYGAS